jgi:tRNA G18 (ribose-2'-O)-methylase SpoU
LTRHPNANNVGAVFRLAAALGFDAVVLSPRCADPYYRRSVKVAMGAVFSVPHARVDDWYDVPALLRRHGFTSVAMTLAEDSVDLDAVQEVPERLALVVGSEGPGLSGHWQRSADVRVRIPMAAGIDSLNVATSVAVACWHLRPDAVGSRRAGQSSIEAGVTGQSSG